MGCHNILQDFLEFPVALVHRIRITVREETVSWFLVSSTVNVPADVREKYPPLESDISCQGVRGQKGDQLCESNSVLWTSMSMLYP